MRVALIHTSVREAQPIEVNAAKLRIADGCVKVFKEAYLDDGQYVLIVPLTSISRITYEERPDA